MRDYVGIIARLRGEGDQEASDALEELLSISRRMTSLGIDLEAQIQEDLTPDFYFTGTEGITFTWTPEELSRLGTVVPPGVPFKLVAVKQIGNSWFVFLSGESEPQEFYTEDAAFQAVAASREK